MSHNQHKETIRNLPAFVKSYIKSEHGRRVVERAVRTEEVSEANSKGVIKTHKKELGYNTLAIAFMAAV